VEIAYWKHQVRGYAPPRDQLVFTEEPREVAKLLSRPDVFERPHRYGTAPNVVQRRVKCVERYFALTREPGEDPYNYRSMPILFLGQRDGVRGGTRFIHIEYLYDQFIPDENNPPQLRVCYSRLGDFFNDFGGGITIFELSHRDGPLDASRPIRLFAGQADPDDASRVLIDYEVGGERGTFTIDFEGERILLWIDGPLDVVSPAES
jgi:hypothetical protein